MEGAILSMGQAACFADRIEPAAAILERLAAEADAAAARLASLATPAGR